MMKSDYLTENYFEPLCSNDLSLASAEFSEKAFHAFDVLVNWNSGMYTFEIYEALPWTNLRPIYAWSEENGQTIYFSSTLSLNQFLERCFEEIGCDESDIEE